MITRQNYKKFDSTIQLYDCRPEIFLAMREYFHPINEQYMLQQYSRKQGFCLIPLSPTLDYNLFDKYDINKVSIPGEWKDLPAFKGLNFQFNLGRSDYVYSIDELINPVGKKYAEYRRKLNVFKTENPEYVIKSIDSSNVSDVFYILWRWEQEYVKNPWVWDEETDYDDACFMMNMKEWVEGIIIYVKGKPVGYVLGFKISDKMWCAYSFKSDNKLEGSHRVIMQELAKVLQQKGYTEVNFCDTGNDLGLIRLKDSYKPIRMIERYELYV